MRRILLIAICSALALTDTWGSWRINFGSQNFVRFVYTVYQTNGNTYSGGNSTQVGGGSTNATWSGWTLPDDSRYLGYAQIKFWSGQTGVDSNNAILFEVDDLNTPPSNNTFNWDAATGTLVQGTNVITQGWFGGPEGRPATNSFSWQFGPEWAGTVVEVKATNGQTLGTWGLPASIGPEGYTLSSSIVTNASLLTGAQVYFDGQLLADIASASATNNPAGLGGYRPGYDIEFDGTYTGGEWQIRRNDGTIAMSGSIATLGDAAAGRFTLTGTNSGTLWTRVPAGDGIGSTWIPTEVTFAPNNSTVSYYLANNPGTPDPTPFPTPAPLASPTPGPTPPASATNSGFSVTNAPAATNDVSVDVEPLELEDADDGEQDVVDGIGEISALVVGIVDDMRTAQTNIIAAGAAFSDLRLSGVGKNCTFQFGPASITLQTSEPVRAGLKLLILGIGAFAAASMIRGAVQS